MLRRLLPSLVFLCAAIVAAPASNLAGQASSQTDSGSPASPQAVKPRPVVPRMPSRSLKGLTVPADPEHPEPAARDFNDARYGVSFHVPAGWNFERKDGVLSNFGVETRTSRRRSDVRGVAEINFNPWPPTTFAGALFYYSVIPQAQAAMCTDQTRTKGMKPLPDEEISGIPFHHGRDTHGAVCTEARDEAFTAMRGSACLRFDLVINTFCSETSGAMEINADQLKDVQMRLAGILGSVKLGK